MTSEPAPTAPVGARVFEDEPSGPYPRGTLIRTLQDMGIDDGVGGSSMVADALLDALWADGSVIVSRDDVEQAVDWMDLTDTPWTGPYEANWADSLLSRDNLRAALDGADR